MMGHTHWVIGAAAWLGTLALTDIAGTLTLNAAVVFGGSAIAAIAALEPDIDTKNSMASKSLGPITGVVSWVIRTAFGGHRKITHSILGMLIMAGVFFGVSKTFGWPAWIPLAAIIGWNSHILSDMLTREGCPLLWPVSKTKFGLHLVTTGKRTEKYGVRPIALIACVVFGAMLIAGY